MRLMAYEGRGRDCRSSSKYQISKRLMYQQTGGRVMLQNKASQKPPKDSDKAQMEAMVMNHGRFVR